MSDVVFSRHTARYVRKGPFEWYATWPLPGAKMVMYDYSGVRTERDCPSRYTAALGPFRFRWLARLAVGRSIL